MEGIFAQIPRSPWGILRTSGAWRGARGEPRQENQKTEIRKRKGKEIEKESPRGYFCGDIEDWIFFVGMNYNLLN